MRLSSVWLQHFRSYSNKAFHVPKGITVIVGDNARGKTNILEAIALLSTGTSFRAQKTEEMVQWGREVGHIKGLVVDEEQHETTLEVVITIGSVHGEKTQKRKYLIDGASRRRKDFVGQLPIVLFRPEDLDLMTDGPSLRRSFLNEVLSQSFPEYRSSLESYEKALKRRNRLLDTLREGGVTRTSFAFWDQLLIKHGNIVTQHRRDFIDFLSRVPDFPMKFRVEYDASTISEKRLHQYAVEEVGAGHTLVGPHKDDFFVFLDGTKEKDLMIYGSRGEQRMGVLWLKVQEMAYIESIRKERPTLLLDDILSELDEKHQKMVITLAKYQQTIFTTTESHPFKKSDVTIIDL